MLTRRNLLALSGAGVAAGVVGACTRPMGQAVSGQVAAKSIDMALRPIETEVDMGGITVRTWAYGDRVPGPEIRIQKGGTIRAQLTNDLPTSTTIHWHGLGIPNAMDGVPVLTQPATLPGKDFTYQFVVPDAGTYWYHPHVGTQLDRGLYGPLIVEDPSEQVDYDDELVVMLDDWIDGTGTNPDQVLANLKKKGMPAMGDTDPNAGVTPTTPLGDDSGDVTYPHYVINGRVPADPQVVDYRAGQRIRLRVINAGADTAFRVAVPDHVLNITHTDGYPVVPTEADSVILGSGERVDATITLNESAPLIAAAYGKDGYGQLNMRVNSAASNVKIDEFVAALSNRAPLNTATLAAAPEVKLPQGDPDTMIDMRLGGPVDGYDWTINGKLYDPPNDGYPVTAGQRVRIRYINESKMFHPMHLHGHTAQVTGPNGPKARKDTVLVPALRTVELDLQANNPGRWITHCHNDYHLASGMATFIYYR